MLSMLMPRRNANISWTPLDERWYANILGAKTRSGITVTEKNALGYAALWAAVRVVSGSSARLPFMLLKQLDRGSEKLWQDHRVFTWNRRFNDEMASFTARALLVQWQMLWGNAVAEIQRNRNGTIQLWPIHPTRVSQQRDPRDNSLYYRVVNGNGRDNEPTDLLPDEVFHAPSILTDENGWGLGIVPAGRENIGLSMGAERAASQMFGSNNTPTVVVETPKLMASDDRAAFRSEWREIHSDGGSGVALLTNGATAKPLTLDYQKMQYLESRTFGIDDVSRWTGVPPHMLANLAKTSQNNIEQLSTEFVNYCLLLWLEPFEQEAEHKLLKPVEQRDHQWKFNEKGLLRGDTAARQSWYQSGITLGWLTRNEVREFEDMNPLDGGDEALVQGAMIPADKAGEQQQAAPSPPQQQNDATAEAWLLSVATRMAKVEANALRRAAEDPGKVLAKVEEYYIKFADTLRDALAEPLTVWAVDATVLAKNWISASQQALQPIFDLKQTEFAAAMAKLCDDMESKVPAATVKAAREMRDER